METGANPSIGCHLARRKSVLEIRDIALVNWFTRISVKRETRRAARKLLFLAPWNTALEAAAFRMSPEIRESVFPRKCSISDVA